MAKIHLQLLAFATAHMLFFPLVSDAEVPVYSDSGSSRIQAKAPVQELTQEPAPIVPRVEVVHEYPRQVSHDPGTPRKPLRDRPGDINVSQCPPERYCEDDCSRAGWPHSLRKWATCSTNRHYSAWYVGGGSACVFPHGRGRTCEEGTWGLDYSLWPRPSHVWMKWTHDREQGGLGAYETDH